MHSRFLVPWLLLRLLCRFLPLPLLRSCIVPKSLNNAPKLLGSDHCSPLYIIDDGADGGGGFCCCSGSCCCYYDMKF